MNKLKWRIMAWINWMRKAQPSSMWEHYFIPTWIPGKMKCHFCGIPVWEGTVLPGRCRGND